MLFYVLSKDDRKMSEHVRGFPNICVCNYNAVVGVYMYIYMVISYGIMKVQENLLGLNVDDLHFVLFMPMLISVVSREIYD